MESGEANPVEGLTLKLSAEAARLEAHRKLGEDLAIYSGLVPVIWIVHGIGSGVAHSSEVDWREFFIRAGLWCAFPVGVPLLGWFLGARTYWRDLEVQLDETSLTVGVPSDRRRLVFGEVRSVSERLEGLTLRGGQRELLEIPRRLNQFAALRSALRERVPQVQWSDFSKRNSSVRIAVFYLCLLAIGFWMTDSFRRGVGGVSLLMSLLVWVWTRPGTRMAVRLGATAAISIGICGLAAVSVVGLARIVDWK